MNTSGDAAEQIVRMSLEGFQVTAKIAGSGAKDIAALLIAVMKDKHKTAGKTNLTNMLKSGKELKVFSVKADEFKKFTEEAKRYGVLYSALINKKDKSIDGIIDIMVRAEDAAKINRIVERFKLSSYDEATIRSEIQKTKEMKVKDMGVKTKTTQEKMNEEQEKAPIKKEDQSLNPHLAKTEKSPQSKPSSKMQRTSDQGTKMKEKTSVREKLDKAKEEVKIRESLREKSELSKVAPKKKKESKEINR